jgi:hypothetical protein
VLVGESLEALRMLEDAADSYRFAQIGGDVRGGRRGGFLAAGGGAQG